LLDSKNVLSEHCTAEHSVLKLKLKYMKYKLIRKIELLPKFEQPVLYFFL